MQAIILQKHTKALLLATSLACATCFIACGGNEGEAKSLAIDFSKSTVAACLKEGGASFAKSTDELRFLSRSEASEEVSKFAIAYDKAAKIAIHVWARSSFENRPPTWLIWIGQPFGDERSPTEIVDIKPANSYVAYVQRPSRAIRDKVESCVKIGKGSHSSVTLHRRDLKQLEEE